MNLLQKNVCGLQTSKINDGSPRKKRVPIPALKQPELLLLYNI